MVVANERRERLGEESVQVLEGPRLRERVEGVLGRERGGKRTYNGFMPRRRPRTRTVWRIIAALLAVGFACAAYIYLTLPDVRVLRTQNPSTTAFISRPLSA